MEIDCRYSWPNFRARFEAALKMLGVLDDASVRPPLLPLGEAELTRRAAALTKVGLLRAAVA